MPDLLAVQDRHRRLHADFTANNTAVLNSDRYRSELNQLVDDVSRLAENAKSVQDYLWLRSTLDQWRAASAVLGIRIDTVIKPATADQLEPWPADRISWSSSSLDEWVRNKAHELNRNRALEWKAELPLETVMRLYAEKNPGDRRGHDWDQAEVYLAADVLDGRLDFAISLDPGSYWRLEGRDGRRWLRAVKDLKAYLLWKRRGGGWDEGAKTNDFIAACSEIHNSVGNAGRKAPLATFEPIQRYIQREFLDPKNGLAGNEKTRQWVRVKTEVAPRDKPAAAEEFMRDFYQSIIPAVLGRDARATAAVMKALGLCRGSTQNENMVNCFEMAIAIYFVDANLAADVMGS